MLKPPDNGDIKGKALVGVLGSYFSGCLSFSNDIVFWTITGDDSSEIGFSDEELLLSLRAIRLDKSGFYELTPNTNELSLLI